MSSKSEPLVGLTFDVFETAVTLDTGDLGTACREYAAQLRAAAACLEPSLTDKPAAPTAPAPLGNCVPHEAVYEEPRR
jgi:hypothetical protein